MAPQGIRRFVFVGLLAAAALPLSAAERSAPVPPVGQPTPSVISQTPPENATHEEFLSWLRLTDLGKMLQRSEDQYDVKRTKAGTGFVIKGGYKNVIVMVAPAKNAMAEPTCIATEQEAEAMMKKAGELKPSEGSEKP
jgi:hypothetical protein